MSLSSSHPGPVSASGTNKAVIDSAGSSSGLQLRIVIQACVAGIKACFLLCLYFWKPCFRSKERSKRINWTMVELRRYRLEEILKATISFSKENLIGSGAFGSVYKGVFDNDGRTLAIKRAHTDSFQTVSEFENEVEQLSRVKHRNLVGLVGYCAEAGQRSLVYEYVPNGSLLEYIIGIGRRPLTWQQRVNIAIGAAKGIAHLHEGVHPSIIHRDIKPSNILIDDGFEAKVSDFGLVKKGPDGDESHVSSQVKGTPGYMDPEYCSTFRLTPFSDVYSFGVILLQLVSASPAINHCQPRSEYHIIDWAKKSIDRGMVEEILDPNLLQEACNMKIMLKMAQLGLRCTASRPKDRPTMSQVVRELETALQHALRSVHRSLYVEELQSISIEGVQLQKFYAEADDNLSLRSVSMRCLDVNDITIDVERKKLGDISEEQ